MLNIKVQSSTSVEETFVFGSPPLLNGFAYNTCRSQEGLVKAKHECFNYNVDCSQCYHAGEVVNKECIGSSPSMKRKEYVQQPNLPIIGYGRSYSNFQHTTRNGCRSIESVAENFNQLNVGGIRGSHVDNGIKILEQAGFKVQQVQPCSDTVFKKRKDLRVLKSALSKERFREVAVKFGDGDEGGKEISESVHRSMRNINSTQVTCLYCKAECQVYENFPIVDGTLFLTPVNRSRDCIKFVERIPNNNLERFMGFICVNCMEGKPKHLSCWSCDRRWKGSFYQVGTMYSYDILSATPCCDKHVTCKNCHQPLIDLSKGEASTLFFSNFSIKSKCPHCQEDDFHFVKPLSVFTLQDS